MRCPRLPILLLSCLWLSAAAAQELVPVPEGVHVPAWRQLSREQQIELARLEQRWDGLPASRRVLILERRARWQHRPEREREAMREGAENFRRMPPPLREKLRRSMQVLRDLPAGQRQALRQQWRSLSPQQRRHWLDRGGPGIAPPP